MEEFVKKVFIPTAIAAGFIFTARNCLNCGDKKNRTFHDETLPTAQIAPVQDKTREELLRVFIVPGECPEEVNAPQITCRKKIPANIFPTNSRRPLDDQYFGGAPGINEHL